MGLSAQDLAIETNTPVKFCKSIDTNGNVPRGPLITSSLFIRLAGGAFDMRG
jgi:hypothetical protein